MNTKKPKYYLAFWHDNFWGPVKHHHPKDNLVIVNLLSYKMILPVVLSILGIVGFVIWNHAQRSAPDPVDSPEKNKPTQPIKRTGLA